MSAALFYLELGLAAAAVSLYGASYAVSDEQTTTQLAVWAGLPVTGLIAALLFDYFADDPMIYQGKGSAAAARPGD